MIGLVDGNNFFVSCERVFDRRLVGRAVAVLSNNDGCCVARSNELKALGIKMGTPYFQLKDRENLGEIIVRSSNYELYGDMSRRIISILREDSVDVEQYSIDEAFIKPPVGVDLMEYGTNLRKKILRWVGIPCGVGFAPTKTLAKIANHIAKKCEVYILPPDPTEILSELPADEIWGVGRRLAPKLRSVRIFTALDLRDADDHTVANLGGVTLLRTVHELRGIPAIKDSDYNADPDSLSCSRSFGEPVTTLDGIRESLAEYASQAAVKLRSHGMLAGGCNIYAQFFRSGGGGEFLETTVAFPSPTDATNEIISAIHKSCETLYRPGMRYRKTGVVFFGLEKAGVAREQDLFSPSVNIAPSALYKSIDRLNAGSDKKKVFSAAQGIGMRSWHVRRDKFSPRATTHWDELVVVR